MTLLLTAVTGASADNRSDTFYGTDVEHGFKEWSYEYIQRGGTKLKAYRGQFYYQDGGPSSMYISSGSEGGDLPLVAEVQEGYGITSVVLQTAPTYPGTPKGFRADNGGQYSYYDYYVESTGTTPGSTITVYFTNVSNHIEIRLTMPREGLELTSVTVNYTSPVYSIKYDGNGSISSFEEVSLMNQTKAHGFALPLRGTEGAAEGLQSYCQLTHNHAHYGFYDGGGYIHDGWATSPDGPKAFDLGGIYTDNKDATLYAHWTPVEYNITYDLDGGTLDTPNPTTYNVESEAITLNNPTREGSVFMGWMLDDVYSGGKYIDGWSRPTTSASPSVTPTAT